MILIPVKNLLQFNEMIDYNYKLFTLLCSDTKRSITNVKRCWNSIDGKLAILNITAVN